jgi:predicted ATPase
VLDVPAPRDGARRLIRTPDQRLRVFVSSTLVELSDERASVRSAVTRLRLAPVMFEAGARAHPPRELYRDYLAQSHVFVGIYWQRYGWVAPGETISGLEDEYLLSGERPKLIYVKAPAPEREPRLSELLDRIRSDDRVSYRPFRSAEELEDLVADDLAVLLTERFDLSTELAPDARGSAPPDTAPIRLDPPPLAAPATPLIGRDREVAHLTGMLAERGVRLVTVSGPGGMGKSRVAAEVARRHAENGRIVAWASLSEVGEQALAPVAVLHALGVREQPNMRIDETIARTIGDADLLLVLDGGERLLGEAGALTRLLRVCPSVQVLVTSRAVLDIRVEREYPLGPLELPAEGATTIAEVACCGAGELFLAVAVAKAPGRVPTDRDAAAVAEICRRLDGLPLAIELAAARVRVFTPAVLLERLANQLAVLTGGARDLPRRQQTLRATLDWDHELLSESEQVLFRRLGACVGGCTLELAEHLAGVLPAIDDDAMDVVASLVGKSLLRHGDGGVGPRFTMLGTVREYAADRLAGAGEDEAVRAAHADFLVGLLERAEPYGVDQVQWLDVLEAERANVLGAMSWARSTQRSELQLRLAAGIAPVWELHGHLAEGAHWLAHAIDASTGQLNEHRADALVGAAHLARSRLDFGRARALLEEALRTVEELGDARRRARCLKDLGIVAGESGDHPTASHLFEQSIVAFRVVGDRLGEAQSLNNLALSTEALGDIRGGLVMYARALTVLREIGDMLSVARLLNNVGSALAQIGKYELAAAAMTRALARYRRIASRWDLTDSLEHLAPVVLARGDARLAAHLLGAAEQLREQLGAPAAPYLEGARLATATAVRAALGEAADAEWRAGRGLGWEAAAAELLTLAPPELIDLDDAAVDIDLERRIATEVGA